MKKLFFTMSVALLATALTLTLKSNSASALESLLSIDNVEALSQDESGFSCKCAFWGGNSYCAANNGGSTCASFSGNGDCSEYDSNCRG